MSRGFGFVTFKDEVSVEKCLVMQHTLNGKPVELKRAIRKEDMGAGGYSGGAPSPSSVAYAYRISQPCTPCHSFSAHVQDSVLMCLPLHVRL